MAQIIFARKIPDAYVIVNKILLLSGKERDSPLGRTKFLPDLLLVISSPEPELSEYAPHDILQAERANETWIVFDEGGRKENYLERMEKPVDQISEGIKVLKEHPYTRRFCISVGRPWDIRAEASPSLLEVYLQVIEDELHITGFFRSIDTYNYLNLNLIGLSELQNRICMETGHKPGTIAAMIVNSHYYERNEKEIEKMEDISPAEQSKHGKMISSEYIPFAWRESLDHIYKNGFVSKTEWGEVFKKKEKAKFAHRLLFDISDPLESMLDDKAPFTKEYGEEYASRYVIGCPKLPVSKDDIRMEEEEAYTYASRARFEPADKDNFGVEPIDQLYFAVNMLRSNPLTRKAAVCISRPWDIRLKDPACLRCYVFQSIDRETLGATFFMRSNDAYGAAAANQYGFARLAEWVASESSFSKVKICTLAANLHIYEDSFDAVASILRPEVPPRREILGLDKPKN
jgi:thymidylate synthase